MYLLTDYFVSLGNANAHAQICSLYQTQSPPIKRVARGAGYKPLLPDRVSRRSDFLSVQVTIVPDALLMPLKGVDITSTIDFTLCYGLLFCTCFSQAYLASTQSVTQMHWRLAARLTGDYLDQTFTGKLITACRTHGLTC